MHIITRSKLREFWEKHPGSWYEATLLAHWSNFVELREVFPSADQVKKLTVFNISGNKYRLIALVDYNYQKVFIRSILTHSEYDKEDWKNDPWYT